MEREKRDTKEFRRLVLLFFWQKEKRRKDNTLLFFVEFSLAEKTRFGKTKLRKLFGKGRTRREMSRKEFLEVLKNC